MRRLAKVRRRDRTCIAAAVVVMVVCIVAATQAFAAHFNQCDNIAGTCIRSRHLAAIMSLQLACDAGAALALGLAYAVAVAASVRSSASRRLWAALPSRLSS